MPKTRIEKLQSLETIIKEALKELGEKDFVKCNFCYRSYEDVNKIIACGLVYICDSCVKLCVDILKDMEKKEKKFDKLFRPKDAKEAINQVMKTITKGDAGDD